MLRNFSFSFLLHAQTFDKILLMLKIAHVWGFDHHCKSACLICQCETFPNDSSILSMILQSLPSNWLILSRIEIGRSRLLQTDDFKILDNLSMIYLVFEFSLSSINFFVLSWIVESFCQASSRYKNFKNTSTNIFKYQSSSPD